MQLYFSLRQSHKQSSKMLIEHTSRSTEDKPETEKCGGALLRSTRCFNQQSLLSQPTQHVSQQPSKQPHGQLKVNPRKVNTGQQQESQRRSVFGQPFDLGSCANMYGLPKSKSPPKISSFGPCVDESQCWSNLRGNPSCNNFLFILLSHV